MLSDRRDDRGRRSLTSLPMIHEYTGCRQSDPCSSIKDPERYVRRYLVHLVESGKLLSLEPPAVLYGIEEAEVTRPDVDKEVYAPGSGYLKLDRHSQRQSNQTDQAVAPPTLVSFVT